MGLTWSEFLGEVAKLPLGQIWRHNEAGDLPGHGEYLDSGLLDDLVRANNGRRGFTFTHKDPIQNRGVLERANANGFAVNISCDSLSEVDRYRRLGLKIPMAVVIGKSVTLRHFRTPGGAHVTVCPAQTTEAQTCQTCGLCAVPNRKAVIGFKAHGSSAKRVTLSSGLADVQLRLPMVK